MTRYAWLRWLTAALALSVASLAQAAAQSTATGVPNAVQGFSQNRDKPIQIQAASLEVREKDKMATFSGDVHVIQGDTRMRCKSLVIYYEDDPKQLAKTKSASAGPAMTTPGGGNQQLKRLEARGGVVVTQGEQTAVGDTGIFDMRANTVTLVGNVAVTRGADVLKGDRLVVNMTTGVSRVESDRHRGVTGYFQSSGSAPTLPGKDAAKPAHQPAPGRSSRAN